MYITSKTDERVVYDFAMPGVEDKNIGICVREKSWTEDGVTKGRDFTVKVAGKPADTFGFNKEVVTKFKETVDVSVEFEIEKLSWNYRNGVLRVSIPRAAFSVGSTVAQSDYVAPTPDA
jgi:HSP20 family molecular chaperone IbpA